MYLGDGCFRAGLLAVVSIFAENFSLIRAWVDLSCALAVPVSIEDLFESLMG